MDLFSNVQLNVEDLPSIKGITFLPLEKQYFNITLINIFIFFTLIIAVLVYLWTIVEHIDFQSNFQWILVGILGFFILYFFYAYKNFTYKAYAFREKDITYKTGWLWRSVTTVPFNRVQHCEVSQGVFDRYFGLAKLKIYTAGGSSSDVSIPGLLLNQATDLKDYILEQIKEDE